MSADINPFWFIGITAGLSLVPVILSMGTSMMKISIILSLIRQSLGTQSVPGPMVTMGLSLAMTLVVMGPTFEACYAGIPADYLVKMQQAPSKENIQRLAPALTPWSDFLKKHSGEREMAAISAIHPQREPNLGERILVFMLTELREAFTLGFLLLIPFLVIDLIVSQVLVGLGLTMLSPTMISLPLKLLLFVGSDAWILLGRGVIQSYQLV